MYINVDNTLYIQPYIHIFICSRQVDRIHTYIHTVHIHKCMDIYYIHLKIVNTYKYINIYIHVHLYHYTYSYICIPYTYTENFSYGLPILLSMSKFIVSSSPSVTSNDAHSSILSSRMETNPSPAPSSQQTLPWNICGRSMIYWHRCSAARQL